MLKTCLKKQKLKYLSKILLQKSSLYVIREENNTFSKLHFSLKNYSENSKNYSKCLK